MRDILPRLTYLPALSLANEFERDKDDMHKLAGGLFAANFEAWERRGRGRRDVGEGDA